MMDPVTFDIWVPLVIVALVDVPAGATLASVSAAIESETVARAIDIGLIPPGLAAESMGRHNSGGVGILRRRAKR